MLEKPEDFPNTLSAEMAVLLQRMAEEDGVQPDPTTMPAAEGRAAAALSNRRWNIDLPPMARIHEVEVPADATLGSAASRTRVLVPAKQVPGAIVFVHGGGFAFCSPETHERCVRVLAIEANMAVVVPDYRLAPENPYPAGLKDVIAALRLLVSNPAFFGIDQGPILIAGDSAGANLALSAMLHEQKLGRTLPQGALLFYGVYSADHTSPSHQRFAEGPGLTTAKMRRYWDWYVPDHSARFDPLVAPLQAPADQLRTLPPLWLNAAGVDPLLSDTLALGQRLKMMGRNDHIAVVPGVVHGFLQMTVSLEAARRSLADAGAAARKLAQTSY